MKTKHTPKEWTIENHEHSINICSGYKGFVIAEVTGDCITHFIGNKEESEANAKLIAAAPVMLEALQKAIEVIERLSDEYSTIAERHASYTVGEARIIEGAIRKATE
jgi:hypothetical protein